MKRRTRKAKRREAVPVPVLRRRIPLLLSPLLLLLLVLWSMTDKSCAFTFRPMRRLVSRTNRVMAPPKAETVGLLEYGDDSGDPNDPAEGWLRWLYTGSPRNTAEVALREPEALGGIPRSDRYSSKDWLHNTIRYVPLCHNDDCIVPISLILVDTIAYSVLYVCTLLDICLCRCAVATCSLPNSAILRDIGPPVCFMTGWATVISFVYKHLLRTNPIAAQRMCLPTTPHSLMVSALGLLLVFRTNSAYQRFAVCI